MAYQQWLRAGRTPIDPEDGGYSEYRGDGSGTRQWGTPGVGQPGPLGDDRPSGGPGAMVFGGNQGEYTDPPPDQLTDGQPGPYTDSPLDDPTLGGTAPDPTTAFGNDQPDDPPDDQPFATSISGTVNVSTTNEDSPPGTNYQAFDPNEYHPAEGGGDADDTDGFTGRAAFTSFASPIHAITADDGMPDRSDDDDDDDPFD